MSGLATAVPGGGCSPFGRAGLWLQPSPTSKPLPDAFRDGPRRAGRACERARGLEASGCNMRALYRRLPEEVRRCLRPLNLVDEVGSFLPARMRPHVQATTEAARRLHAATIRRMATRYEQLLDATMQHLQEMKARGARFVAVQPDTMAALKRAPRLPAAAPPVPTPAPSRMATAPVAAPERGAAGPKEQRARCPTFPRRATGRSSGCRPRF